MPRCYWASKRRWIHLDSITEIFFKQFFASRFEWEWIILFFFSIVKCFCSQSLNISIFHNTPWILFSLRPSTRTCYYLQYFLPWRAQLRKPQAISLMFPSDSVTESGEWFLTSMHVCDLSPHNILVSWTGLTVFGFIFGFVSTVTHFCLRCFTTAAGWWEK